MVSLQEHLRLWSRRPWIWGTHDCCTFAADFVRERTGIDPMAEFRGRYGSEEEARWLIEAAGGLGVLFRRALAPLPRTGAGVVQWHGGPETGALMGETFAHLYTAHGILSVRRASLNVVCEG